MVDAEGIGMNVWDGKEQTCPNVGRWKVWRKLAVVSVLALLGVGCTATVAPAPVTSPAPSARIETVAEVPPTPTATALPPARLEDHGPPASAEVYPSPTSVPALAAPAQAATSVPAPVPALRAAPTPIVTAAPLPVVPAGSPGQRTIALDPGHGGPAVGAASGSFGEKTANLEIAFRVKRLLEEQGFRVVLTRDSDRRAFTLPDDQADSPRSIDRADLQGRIDIANASRADVFVSIHNNGSGDPGQSGTEVWVDPTRPQGRLSVALANEVLAALVAEIRAAGHPVVNRGLKDAANFRVFQGQTFPIFVLGSPRGAPNPTRATNMPGILGETLFLSNPIDAQALRREDIQEAIARGYRNGILHYFQRLDAGELGSLHP